MHALYEAARARRQRIEERTIDTGDFRTEADDTDDLVIRETSGRTAALTHWSFGQLATIASAPPNYLRTLPAEIASRAINYGLQRVDREQHQLFVERPSEKRALRISVLQAPTTKTGREARHWYFRPIQGAANKRRPRRTFRQRTGWLWRNRWTRPARCEWQPAHVSVSAPWR